MRLTSWMKPVGRAASAVQGCNPSPENSGNLIQDIYREHLQHRQIIVTGVITEDVVEMVALQIMKFNEEDDEHSAADVRYNRLENPITLKIASPGGYISSGMAVVSQIRQSLTPVIGVAVGDCSSMAAMILISCHVRVASIYSRIMLHSLYGGTEHKLQGIMDYAEDVKSLQQTLDDIIVERTGITQKQMTDLHDRHKDWYLKAEEAKALGVVDEVNAVGLQIAPFKDRKKPVKAKAAK